MSEKWDLSEYATVAERIAEAKGIYPDGRFQSRIVEVPAAFAGSLVAVEARFFRTSDDPCPAIGLAWEPVPGKTPYTRDSELMNAETSAWGRALIATFAADAKKGIASAEEVANRQVTTGFSCPACNGLVVDNRAVYQADKTKPAWKCGNKACQGGKPRKGGKTNWPWASWNLAEFTAPSDDGQATNAAKLRVLEASKVTVDTRGGGDAKAMARSAWKDAASDHGYGPDDPIPSEHLAEVEGRALRLLAEWVTLETVTHGGSIPEMIRAARAAGAYPPGEEPFEDGPDVKPS